MNQRNHSSDKGYKQTEVGVIPEDWEVTPLGQISDVIMGQSPIGSTYNKAGEGVALINGPTEFTDVYPVKVQWTTHPTKICKKNDLLICVRGSSTGRMNLSDDEYCIGRGVAAIRAKSSSNTVYLTNQIHLGIERLLSLSAGSTFPNVDGKSIRSILIPLPPTKAEQTAIAAALSDADALIQSLEKLIAKKRNIKQGAMQEMLKPKEGWVVKKLGEIAPLQRGFDLPTTHLVQGIYPVVYSNGVLTHHAKFMVKGPGVVTGRSGTLGNVHYVEQDFWPHNTTLWVTSFKENDPKFIFYLYSSIGFDRFGTGSGVPTLNRNDAHEFKVSVPISREQQTRIATILSDMDTEISALENKLAKYKQIKQGMMQELLTGKTRLV